MYIRLDVFQGIKVNYLVSHLFTLRKKKQIKKPKIMASGPITSWQIDGEKVESEIYFIFLSSKITENGDCSHKIKRCFLLGGKAIRNL